MKTFKFKTNINCGRCVEKVKPFFEKEPRIKNWNIDTKNPDKTLTVESEDLKSKDIKNLVSEAGFMAEEKSGNIFAKIFG